MKYLYALCLIRCVSVAIEREHTIKRLALCFMPCIRVTVQNILIELSANHEEVQPFISYSSMRLFAKLPYESQLFHRNEASASTANLLKFAMRNEQKKRWEGISVDSMRPERGTNKIVPRIANELQFVEKLMNANGNVQTQ